ncbi:MAG TPA: DNA polymerase III subunit gamma/tau, partial [Xanthomonadales bacterium]|nr:DNA polymerase III subunit gamma/tau [Xanthomonadales bacterium]
QDRVHHAFLFSGTRGVGKTTIARILAKCLNCETGVTSKPCGECSSCVDIDAGRFVDMLEIDAASRTKVDDTRELLDSVQYTPSRGRYKVYIIDEVHMLSTSSFNALLKTLEEPPPHVKFVLATTDPEKIPVTILSRCLQFNLRRLLPRQIREYLEMIVQSEEIEAEHDALSRLSRAADGSMRDGLSLLDQAIAYGGGSLVTGQVENMLGLVDHGHIAAMISALAEGDADRLLSIVEELIAQSRDVDNVLGNLAETLHRVCLVQCVPSYNDEERSDWESVAELAQAVSAEDVQLFYQIAIKGRQDLGIAPDPRTGLEMTLLRMLAFRPQEAGSGKPGARGGGQAMPEPAKQNAVASKPPVAAKPKKSAQAPQAPQSARSDIPTEQHTGSVTASAGGASSSDSDWISLARNLNISGPVRELARNVHLHSRSDDQWEFVIAHSLKHLGSKSCVSRLSQALSDELGHPVMVRLIDSDDMDLPTQARKEEQQLKLKMTDAERAILDDPTVQSLKQEFGARLVEDSVQPLQ